MAERKMRDRIKDYLSAWSFMRVVRLGLGTVILVEGLMRAEMMSIVLGGAFAGMALMNIGCNGACAINTIGSDNKYKEPEFEEVVIKK